jgi:hypothetical protein
MAKKPDKQGKAVKKLKKVVRKTVDQGVSGQVVSAAVKEALGAMADVDTGGAGNEEPVSAKARKLPGLRKYPSLPGKRGFTADAKAADEPVVPDSEKPSLKKLPGKRKPPTLTLKRGNTDAAAAPASKRATKVTGLNKQTDVTMKRG